MALNNFDPATQVYTVHSLNKQLERGGFWGGPRPHLRPGDTYSSLLRLLNARLAEVRRETGVPLERWRRCALNHRLQLCALRRKIRARIRARVRQRKR